MYYLCGFPMLSVFGWILDFWLCMWSEGLVLYTVLDLQLLGLRFGLLVGVWF